MPNFGTAYALKINRVKIVILGWRKIMFETFVILFWFVVFYLAHKIYYDHKIKMIKKDWARFK